MTLHQVRNACALIALLSLGGCAITTTYGRAPKPSALAPNQYAFTVYGNAYTARNDYDRKAREVIDRFMQAQDFRDFRIESVDCQNAMSSKCVYEVQFSRTAVANNDPVLTPVRTPAAPAPATPTLAATGTGFLVTRQGHVLTNAHVIQDCADVRGRGSATPMKVVRVDPQNDLALLKREGGATAVAAFRGGRSIRPGDAVVVVGFPLSGVLASEANVTTGGVSALAGMGDDFRFLQITAPVQPGNSGGPLLDASGHVVGVVTSQLDALKVAQVTGDIPQNINFAINASVARIFLDAVGVPYQTRVSTSTLGAADVGENAKAFTVLLECWR